MEMRRLLSKTLEFIKASMESGGSGTFGIIINKGKFEIFLPESTEELISVYDWVGSRVSEVEDKVGIYVNFLNVRDMASDKAVGLLCWDGQKRKPGYIHIKWNATI